MNLIKRVLLWKDYWKYYDNPSGMPTKCIDCGSPLFDESVGSEVAGVASEVEVYCMNCGNPASYWAYGSYCTSEKPRFWTQTIFVGKLGWYIDVITNSLTSIRTRKVKRRVRYPRG